MLQWTGKYVDADMDTQTRLRWFEVVGRANSVSMMQLYCNQQLNSATVMARSGIQICCLLSAVRSYLPITGGMLTDALSCATLSCTGVTDTGALLCTSLSCTGVTDTGTLSCTARSCTGVTDIGTLSCETLSCTGVTDMGHSLVRLFHVRVKQTVGLLCVVLFHCHRQVHTAVLFLRLVSAI